MRNGFVRFGAVLLVLALMAYSTAGLAAESGLEHRNVFVVEGEVVDVVPSDYNLVSEDDPCLVWDPDVGCDETDGEYEVVAFDACPVEERGLLIFAKVIDWEACKGN